MDPWCKALAQMRTAWDRSRLEAAKLRAQFPAYRAAALTRPSQQGFNASRLVASS
jgi:hypothetical protein